MDSPTKTTQPETPKKEWVTPEMVNININQDTGANDDNSGMENS